MKSPAIGARVEGDGESAGEGEGSGEGDTWTSEKSSAVVVIM
jgi:hypothetical protein